MKTPLLFGKRRPLETAVAAQYVGTDTEMDPKTISDRELKTDIRPLVREPDADEPRRS
jgi:hypothetical protein